MTKVEITQRARDLVRSRAEHDFHDNAVKLPNGMWQVDLSQDVLGALYRMKVDGETLSDTIERAVLTFNRKPS